MWAITLWMERQGSRGQPDVERKRLCVAWEFQCDWVLRQRLEHPLRKRLTGPKWRLQSWWLTAHSGSPEWFGWLTRAVLGGHSIRSEFHKKTIKISASNCQWPSYLNGIKLNLFCNTLGKKKFNGEEKKVFPWVVYISGAYFKWLKKT